MSRKADRAKRRGCDPVVFRWEPELTMPSLARHSGEFQMRESLCSTFIRVGSPRTTSFIRSALQELEAPKSFRERNLAQLQLGERVSRQFDMDVTSAVEAVAPLYDARFPQPHTTKRLTMHFPH